MMSIGEAIAVDLLVQWALGKRAPGNGVEINEANAMESAAFLADKAHKVLMAGVTGADVKRAWRKDRP